MPSTDFGRDGTQQRHRGPPGIHEADTPPLPLPSGAARVDSARASLAIAVIGLKSFLMAALAAAM